MLDLARIRQLPARLVWALNLLLSDPRTDELAELERCAMRIVQCRDPQEQQSDTGSRPPTPAPFVVMPGRSGHAPLDTWDGYVTASMVKTLFAPFSKPAIKFKQLGLPRVLITSVMDGGILKSPTGGCYFQPLLQSEGKQHTEFYERVGRSGQNHFGEVLKWVSYRRKEDKTRWQHMGWSGRHLEACVDYERIGTSELELDDEPCAKKRKTSSALSAEPPSRADQQQGQPGGQQQWQAQLELQQGQVQPGGQQRSQTQQQLQTPGQQQQLQTQLLQHLGENHQGQAQGEETVGTCVTFSCGSSGWDGTEESTKMADECSLLDAHGRYAPSLEDPVDFGFDNILEIPPVDNIFQIPP